MTSSSMRLLDERHVATKVDLMSWSNKMDLLALSNIKGEVALHRLSWQRVWILPPQEGALVQAMAWRPDGKVIAIAYSTHEVLLVDVENRDTLHTAHVDADVTCLSWVQEKDTQAASEKTSHYKFGDPTNCYPGRLTLENASCFLPELRSYSRGLGVKRISNEENLEDSKRIRDQKSLNILLIGLANGHLHLSIFGLFPCGSVDLRPHTEPEGGGAVIEATVSDDLRVVCAILARNKTENEGRELHAVLLDTSLLATHSRELLALALKHGHISSLQGTQAKPWETTYLINRMWQLKSIGFDVHHETSPLVSNIFLVSGLFVPDYLSSTMQAITEAWESILLEMDTKLASYASTVAEGAVAADFLDLLMLGVPSTGLEIFLQRDLTDKGLKKLSHSIELSHSNIQNLVIKRLNCVASSFTYHLAELRGMARYSERFSLLGLKESTVAAALSAAGAFLIKSTEVQQVNDISMKNYKAFFRWLYAAILRLSDERVPPEITKCTQQDVAFIADFLCKFDVKSNRSQSPKVHDNDTAADSDESPTEDGDKVSRVDSPKHKSVFNLERLGQYLVDKELTVVPDSENNPWNQLLAADPCLAQHQLIIPHFKKMSLVQQHHHLTSAIGALFKEPAECVSLAWTLQRSIRLPDSSFILPQPDNRRFRVSMTHCSTEHRLLLSYPNSDSTLHMLELPTSSSEQVTVSSACLCFNAPLHSEKNDCPGNNQQLKVVDCQFYLPDVLSVLLEKRGEDHSAVFLQLPRRCVKDTYVTFPASSSSFRTLPPADVSTLLEAGSMKPVDNMVACRLAVSGSRKVAVILSENRCTVRLFEMETEEDEEEDETMDATASTVRDSDQSHLLDQSKSSEVDD